ncbi:hypothetical protein P389DRAFT_98448 [Cystobasidium minutum MCA 4210]|uniref:uncharacterized protein n=1 Tax=Cystobasidium minutum MCA 4210 TaxID=1397322 RepID=UPI0034CEC749|eukprot:jgi/Rhomi1/98448/CE98447_17688
MTGHDLPPPSYDESASSASEAPPPPPPAAAGQSADEQDINLTDVTARPQPPPTAQRAQAPLLITKANERITQDYVVAIGENKAGPDVILKTTNATIKSCVYLQGNVPRTAEVTVETTNASIATMFPDKQAGQAVLFNVRTTNSKVEVAFPQDFDGIVTTKTSNAKTIISDGLRAHSMIVPNPPGSSSGLTTYRIQPPGSEASASRDSKTPMDDAQLDICHIQTSNSGISIGYLNEVDSTLSKGKGKKESSSCTIA